MHGCMFDLMSKNNWLTCINRLNQQFKHQSPSSSDINYYHRLVSTNQILAASHLLVIPKHLAKSDTFFVQHVVKHACRHWPISHLECNVCSMSAPSERWRGFPSPSASSLQKTEGGASFPPMSGLTMGGWFPMSKAPSLATWYLELFCPWKSFLCIPCCTGCLWQEPIPQPLTGVCDLESIAAIISPRTQGFICRACARATPAVSGPVSGTSPRSSEHRSRAGPINQQGPSLSRTFGSQASQNWDPQMGHLMG